MKQHLFNRTSWFHHTAWFCFTLIGIISLFINDLVFTHLTLFLLITRCYITLRGHSHRAEYSQVWEVFIAFWPRVNMKTLAVCPKQKFGIFWKQAPEWRVFKTLLHTASCKPESERFRLKRCSHRMRSTLSYEGCVRLTGIITLCSVRSPDKTVQSDLLSELICCPEKNLQRPCASTRHCCSWTFSS